METPPFAGLSAQSPLTPKSELETAAAPTDPTRPPEVLGTLKLKRNETISGLINKIYGNYSNKHFRSIILANPDITDPDILMIGRSIQVPADPVSVKPLNKEVWWVKIGEWPVLQEAFELLRAYPDSAPPVRLVPCWQPATGLRFIVVLKQIFNNPDAAQLQLKYLPPNVAASGQVIRSWGEKTVFFADPYPEVPKVR